MQDDNQLAVVNPICNYLDATALFMLLVAIALVA